MNDVDVNIKDNKGRRALVLVAASGHTEIAVALIKHSADVDSKDY